MFASSDGTLQLVKYLQPHSLIQPSRCRTIRALLEIATIATTCVVTYMMYTTPLLMTTRVLCRTVQKSSPRDLTVHYMDGLLQNEPSIPSSGGKTTNMQDPTLPVKGNSTSLKSSNISILYYNASLYPKLDQVNVECMFRLSSCVYSSLKRG